MIVVKIFFVLFIAVGLTQNHRMVVSKVPERVCRRRMERVVPIRVGKARKALI